MTTRLELDNFFSTAQSAIAAAKHYGEVEGANVQGWRWTEAKRDYDDAKQSLRDEFELLRARATN